MQEKMLSARLERGGRWLCAANPAAFQKHFCGEALSVL